MRVRLGFLAYRDNGVLVGRVTSRAERSLPNASPEALLEAWTDFVQGRANGLRSGTDWPAAMHEFVDILEFAGVTSVDVPGVGTRTVRQVAEKAIRDHTTPVP